VWKQTVTVLIKKAYKLYFGAKQMTRIILVCANCAVYLRAWLKDSTTD
jgi:hypothetical protein